jgi:hypothetical protein
MGPLEEIRKSLRRIEEKGINTNTTSPYWEVVIYKAKIIGEYEEHREQVHQFRVPRTLEGLDGALNRAMVSVNAKAHGQVLFFEKTLEGFKTQTCKRTNSYFEIVMKDIEVSNNIFLNGR